LQKQVNFVVNRRRIFIKESLLTIDGSLILTKVIGLKLWKI